jgi:hypothetical protein
MRSKEDLVLDHLERQKEWLEAFREYVESKKLSPDKVDDIMNMQTGVVRKIVNVQVLGENALKTNDVEDLRYAIMRHQNLRSWLSKRYKVYLR